MKKKVFLHKITSCCVLFFATGFLNAAGMQNFPVPLTEQFKNTCTALSSATSKFYNARVNGDYSDLAKEVVEVAVSQIFNIQYTSGAPLTGSIITNGVETLLKMMLLGTNQYVINDQGQKMAVYQNGNVYAELLKKMGLNSGIASAGGFVINSSIHQLFAAKLNNWIEETIKTFLGDFAKNMLAVEIKPSVQAIQPKPTTTTTELPVEEKASVFEGAALESTHNFLFAGQKEEKEEVDQQEAVVEKEDEDTCRSFVMIEHGDCQLAALASNETTVLQKLTDFLGLTNLQLRMTHLLRETLFSLFENVYRSTIQKSSRVWRLSGSVLETGVMKTIKAGLVKTLPYTKEEIQFYHIDEIQSSVVKGMFDQDETTRKRSTFVLQHIANYKSSLPKSITVHHDEYQKLVNQLSVVEMGDFFPWMKVTKTAETRNEGNSLVTSVKEVLMTPAKKWMPQIRRDNTALNEIGYQKTAQKLFGFVEGMQANANDMHTFIVCYGLLNDREKESITKYISLLDFIKSQFADLSAFKRMKGLIYRHLFGLARCVIDLNENPLSAFIQEVMVNIRAIHPSLYAKDTKQLREMKVEDFRTFLDERKKLQESFIAGISALNTMRFNVFKERVVDYLFCSVYAQLHTLPKDAHPDIIAKFDGVFDVEQLGELSKVRPSTSQSQKSAFNFVTTHADSSPEYGDYYLTKFVLMQLMGVSDIPESSAEIFDYSLSALDVLAHEKVQALLAESPGRGIVCDVSMHVKAQAHKVKGDDSIKKKIDFYEVNYEPWLLKESLAKAKAKKVFPSITDVVDAVDQNLVA